MADGVQTSTRSATFLRTALWLAAFVAIAFTLRTVFNVDAGFDDASGRNTFTGNDPYYDWHSIESTLATGKNLDYDHAVNYPEGRANPNPPLYDWTTLPLAAGLQKAGVADPTGTALNIMVATWAALTVIPVYMIGKDVFGRKAGLWAAFFMAISAPHIQRTALGYPRHEAIALFFIVLALAFLVRAFTRIQARDYVASWRNGSAIGKGLKEAVRANRSALAYGALAGLALTACADTWKGYPYALAILAVGAALQLFVDHLRNRDSTAVFLVYLTATAIAAILPWLLVYQHFPGFLPTTVYPSLYVLAGMLVAGIILVPTRDLPSILVFPALVVAGLLGLLLLLVVFPGAGHAVFSGLGYFNQSKLYGTIAEAQRPRLGEVAANFGFFAFLVAFWGFGRVAKGGYKGEASNILVASWAVVALFMTFAASRFLMNASPVMSILIGYAIMRLVAWAAGDEVRRRFRSAHGTGIVGRSLKSLSWKTVVGVLLVALFLIVPNVWTGVDAGMSTEFEQQHGLLHPASSKQVNRFGAFGIDFELKSNGWLPSMAYLAKQDTGKPIEQKPAFIAWWDYGHWAVGIGDHPTVADPFQSHYELAGRFLASDSEEEGMAWLTLGLLGGNYRMGGGHLSGSVAGYLDGAGYGNLTRLDYNQPLSPQYAVFNATVPHAAVYGVYEKVCELTQTCVGYMGVDARMYPYDDPNTVGQIERQSIFYAPVFLANKNPDDYLKVQFRGSQGLITMHRYATNANGDSYEMAKPTYEDAQGQPWVEYQGYLYRPGLTPLQGYPATSGIALFGTEQMTVTSKFYTTMFARAFGGLTDGERAGDGLSHWRVVQQTLVNATATVKLRDVALLQYYHGVPVSGTLRDDGGDPLAGYTVSFQDGGGASHASAVTGADGKFTALAPFAQDNDVQLVVMSANGAVVHTEKRDALQFTPAQAAAGAAVATGDVTVKRGGLLGHVFVDNDGDQRFTANDTALGGVTIKVAGREVKSDTATGTYGVDALQAGSYQLTATLDGYAPASLTANVASGKGTTLDVPMTVLPTPVKVTVLDNNGAPLPNVQVTASGPTEQGSGTNATGVALLSLTPGTYALHMDANVTQGGQVVHYAASGSVTVVLGDKEKAVVLRAE